MSIKVMKFGGTSVGTASRMKEVASLVTASSEPTFVVLSAMSGTTNALIEIADYLYKKNPEGANEVINKLEDKYLQHVQDLYSTEEYKLKTKEFLIKKFEYLRSFTKDLFTSFEEKNIVAQGEIMSTNMVTNYLREKGIKVILLNALDFMRTDKNGEPDSEFIKKELGKAMEQHKDFQIYITQGFICRNAYGEVDNLLRGGSDYTASLIGVALSASEIQIWTDIDGMHNNDPRVVKKTEALHQLNFEEAAELAYFGAKIKAVAAKDNITAVKIKSSRMLLATGFLRKVFEIFESNQTPIDMITTSEVGVSMSIDSEARLNEIVNELKKYGTVSVDHDMCIVCVVGDLDWKNLGFETLVLEAMKSIPVRMISYGGSNYNISFLINAKDKQRALQQLSDVLFQH